MRKSRFTDDDIGEQLSISSDAINAHVQHIGEKLGVRGRHAVVAEATRHGLLQPGELVDDPERPVSDGA